MLRLALTLIIVFLVAGLVAWLAIQPGEIVAVWRDTRITMDAATAIVLTAITLAILVAIVVALSRAARTPTNFRRGRLARHRRRGLDALSAGMVAIAAGDSEAARKRAGDAHKRLGDAPLVLLLTAQAEQLAGDNAGADRAFRAMLDHPETEFLGLRGLVVQALRRGDRDPAMPLLERARALRPKSPWVLNTLFELACGARNWTRAGELLDEMKRARLLAEPDLRRRRMLIYTAAAQDAEASGSLADARELASRATKLNPVFPPAAVIEARGLAAKGDARKAAKVLERAWSGYPHPLLARAYWDLRPEETPVDRLARTRHLVASNPDARESRISVAEQALAADDPAAAGEALALVTTEPTVHVCVLHAALAHAEHDETAAQDWLLRCTQAMRDPTWLCRACGKESIAWHAVCPACGGFDTLHWVTPSEQSTGDKALPGADRPFAELAGPAAAPPIVMPEPEGPPEPPRAPSPEQHYEIAHFRGRAPDDPGPETEPETQAAPAAGHSPTATR